MLAKKSLASLFLIISYSAQAQMCNEFMVGSAKDGQYIVNGDSTVSDAVNRLIWDQCSFGQIYTDGQCLGAPQNFETWQEALQLAEQTPGKFLPNIKELSTLVNRSCVDPAIDRVAYPDTPLAMYWSNTPDSSAIGNNPKGRLVDFTDGGEIVRDVNRPKYIRFLNVIGN